MSAAKLQNSDLGKTEQFFDTLMSNEEFKKVEKNNLNDMTKAQQANGSMMPFKLDGKPRFSDPPAPPPQQPLPEKPDAARSHPFDSSPSLKRTNTERPVSGSNVSPSRQSGVELGSLVEALKEAKKEIDAQNSRMRDLEKLLQEEREARESAEGRAKILELESATTTAKMNDEATPGNEGSIIDEAFDPPAESSEEPTEVVIEEPSPITESIEESTSKLQERLDLMMSEMREMKQNMESYRQRAETAEAERDADRKTLAEMVLKIRADDARRSTSTERARSSTKINTASASPAKTTTNTGANGGVSPRSKGDATSLSPLNPLTLAQIYPPGSDVQLLYHSGPYASMVGIVLLGMGLMAYMNGWQKVER